MKIPPLTALRSEDYPSERGWIGGLFQALNRFFLAVSSAINGNIIFGENIPSVTHDVSFQWNGTADLPKSFRWGLTYTPAEMRAVQLFENGVPRACAIAWQYTGTVLQVTDITLFEDGAARSPVVGASYRLKVRANP